MRDFQRKKVYDSEAQIREDFQLFVFNTDEDIQMYINSLLKRRWTKNRFNCDPISVITASKSLTSHAYSFTEIREVVFPLHYRDELVVLHEISHCFQPWDSCAHGVEFSAIFLQLTTKILGKEFGKEFKQCFIDNGVQFDWNVPILNRTTSEDQNATSYSLVSV